MKRAAQPAAERNSEQLAPTERLNMAQVIGPSLSSLPHVRASITNKHIDVVHSNGLKFRFGLYFGPSMDAHSLPRPLRTKCYPGTEPLP